MLTDFRMHRLLILISAVLTLLALSPSGILAHAPGPSELEAAAHVSVGHVDDSSGGGDAAGSPADVNGGHTGNDGALSCSSMVGHCSGALLASNAQPIVPEAATQTALPGLSTDADGLIPEAETPPPRV